MDDAFLHEHVSTRAKEGKETKGGDAVRSIKQRYLGDRSSPDFNGHQIGWWVLNKAGRTRERGTASTRPRQRQGGKGDRDLR